MVSVQYWMQMLTFQQTPWAPDSLTGKAWAAGFKYQEVVRKKDARAALPAFDCPECRGFYETVGLRPDGQAKPTSNRGVPGRSYS